MITPHNIKLEYKCYNKYKVNNIIIFIMGNCIGINTLYHDYCVRTPLTLNGDNETRNSTSETRNSTSETKKNTEKSLQEELSNINIKKLKQFIIPVSSGIVIKVYDGDTITIASKVDGLENSEIYKFSVRLNGIDTPEMKTKDDDEKYVAKLAQKALSDRILNKEVILKNVQNEKYGRLLSEVYIDNVNLNEWLIKERYAVRYDGGTKQIPKSWTTYHKNGKINE